MEAGNGEQGERRPSAIALQVESVCRIARVLAQGTCHGKAGRRLEALSSPTPTIDSHITPAPPGYPPFQSGVV